MIRIIQPPTPKKETKTTIGVWLEYEDDDILLKSFDGITSKIELRICQSRTAYFSKEWSNLNWYELGC
jgi:hypothetical protein